MEFIIMPRTKKNSVEQEKLCAKCGKEIKNFNIFRNGCFCEDCFESIKLKEKNKFQKNLIS